MLICSCKGNKYIKILWVLKSGKCVQNVQGVPDGVLCVTCERYALCILPGMYKNSAEHIERTRRRTCSEGAFGALCAFFYIPNL